MGARGSRVSLGNLAPRGTQDHQVCLVTRVLTVSRATLAYPELRDPEDTEDQPDRKDRLESPGRQVLEDLKGRWETPGLRGSREMLGSPAGEVRG